MAATLIISTAARQAAMDAVTALINTGGAGTINVYDGTQPAGPGTAITSQNLLATLTFSADAFGDTNSSGVAAAAAITDGTGIYAGTITWARIASGAGTAIFDCNAGGPTGGPYTMTFGADTIAVGNVVKISSFTLTHPA